jgi:hypothetical protein
MSVSVGVAVAMSCRFGRNESGLAGWKKAFEQAWRSRVNWVDPAQEQGLEKALLSTYMPIREGA